MTKRQEVVAMLNIFYSGETRCNPRAYSITKRVLEGAVFKPSVFVSLNHREKNCSLYRVTCQSDFHLTTGRFFLCSFSDSNRLLKRDYQVETKSRLC